MTGRKREGAQGPKPPIVEKLNAQPEVGSESGQAADAPDVSALIDAARTQRPASPELGGPTVATLGALLSKYAHQFTVLKGGWQAELTRINHYLIGAGIRPLECAETNGVRSLRPKACDVGEAVPSGWRAHRSKRREQRATTYALIHALGAMRCSEISTSLLRTLNTTMKAEGLSESTVQKEFAVLKSAFNVAVREWNWGPMPNPVVGIRLGRSASRFVRLSADEEGRLVGALAECDNPEFWPLVELALTSSMRRGSLLRLEWANIDLEHRQVRVWAKGYDVTLPLSQRAVDLLRRTPRNGGGRVFSMTANSVKMAWQRVRERAGLSHLRFSDLRHLAATFYARAGLNAHQLRLVLGHRTTHMAEVYVNLATNDVTEALDKAEAARPIRRPLPPTDVHAGLPGRSVMAERRATRLNGQQKLPGNVVRLTTRGRDKDDE